MALTLQETISQPSSMPTVTTLEDLDKAFEPYEKMMHSLLDKTRSGEYASLGLEPSMAPCFAMDTKGQDIAMA